KVAADLAKLPKSPEAEVGKAREGLERLEAVARLVPVLEKFRGRREELRQEAAAVEKAGQALQKAQQGGEASKADVEGLKAQAEKAAGTVREATEAAAEARTLSQQAKESLAELTGLEGAKICRHCGQPLTPGHVDEQKKKRGAEAKQA